MERERGRRRSDGAHAHHVQSVVFSAVVLGLIPSLRPFAGCLLSLIPLFLFQIHTIPQNLTS